MAETDKLLIEIQKAIGCCYLSDLHSGCRLLSEQSKAHIMAIPLERYTVQEWNMAATYITGEKCCYQTTEEARARIAVGTQQSYRGILLRSQALIWKLSHDSKRS